MNHRYSRKILLVISIGLFCILSILKFHDYGDSARRYNKSDVFSMLKDTNITGLVQEILKDNLAQWIQRSSRHDAKDVLDSFQALKVKSFDDDGFFNVDDIPDDLGLKYVAKPIPKELIEHVKSLKSPYALPNCKVQSPKKNFVYIKVHKAASDTLSAIFRRFSYDRNLSIALPVGPKFSLGWPHDLTESYHRPSKTGGFNVLLDHCKYTEDYMKKIFPEDTVYIASWRETFAHLKSAMAYMMILQWSGIKEKHPEGMETFLRDMKSYDDLYKILPPENPFRKRYSCIPYDISMARNSMAADLGFPVGFPKGMYPDYSDNHTAIKEWLDHSNKVFSVVLIADHFHHSLVMLKRMMCWSTKDILYTRLNTWNTKYKPDYDKILKDNFKRWSAADYLAFELFNNTLWNRIEEWGREDFQAEVDAFEKQLKETLDFCKKITQSSDKDSKLMMAETKWSESYVIDAKDCKLLRDHLRDVVKKQYDDIPGDVVIPKILQVPGC